MTMSSKKLSGNGLWESSRMMLPQHREALAERRKQKPQEKYQLPAFEELVLIRNAVILPMIISIVEKNIRQLKIMDISLKEVYIRVSDILIDRIIRDIEETKRLLRTQGIKLGEEEKVDEMLRVRFQCRGYEDDLVITKDMVKSELSVKIKTYIDDIFCNVKERAKS